MKSVATHSGTFHADDVFAVAVLKLIYPELEVIRTRDEEKFSKADARVDVGHKYSFETLDFDHHQTGGAKDRENGIPYASAGLVWKHFGSKLVANEDIVGSLDKKLFQPIDADDAGVKIYTNIYDCSPYTIPQIINTFKPSWKEANVDFDAYFEKAVQFAMDLLTKEITAANDKYDAYEEVLSCIEESKKSIDPNGEYVVLKRFCPYQKTVRENSEAKFVVFQGVNKEWIVRGIHTKADTFEIRKNLPSSWAGLQSQELAKVTGVSDSTFCHRSLFICSAKSYEGAISLVEQAISNKE